MTIMDNKLYFETAMLAGEIELRSGSEISRVEDTMQRILAQSGAQQAEVYATTTGIIASLSTEDATPLTGVKRIAARANNLNRIYLVNEVSRQLCADKISVEEAYHKLVDIQDAKEHSDRFIWLCMILTVMGFTILFGGNAYDFVLSAIPAIGLVIIEILIAHTIYIDFMKDIIKTMEIAFVSMLVCYFFPEAHSGVIIISALMPLVPGIPITNGIRDTLQGDYTSGMARILEALVVSIGIAVGAGLGLGLFHLLERGLTL